MKKTMTKEDLYAIMKSCEEYNDDAGFSVLDGKMFIDALSEAGISFDIYTDSDGKIIKPGDMCEFWHNDDINDKRYKARFVGIDKESTIMNYYCSESGWFGYCRKLPAEVWEPVPMEDIVFGRGDGGGYYQFEVDETKWKEWRINNGKLEGVRK